MVEPDTEGAAPVALLFVSARMLVPEREEVEDMLEVLVELLRPAEEPDWLVAAEPIAEVLVSVSAEVMVSVPLRAHPAEQINNAAMTANFFIFNFPGLSLLAGHAFGAHRRRYTLQSHPSATFHNRGERCVRASRRVPGGGSDFTSG